MRAMSLSMCVRKGQLITAKYSKTNREKKTRLNDDGCVMMCVDQEPRTIQNDTE